ncbi:hypothetical protein UNSWDHB_2000 [Dehalobacter sp. UNSWDHB]|jgi:hypothetical protein|uniref:tetratricopeptide repeat protein n=1 Tax=unclassified Dehalobacter TaxID=2635733 RepID=UPI00028A8804|nr:MULTISPECIES: tetratricopeptide repeat protein [unclassified Dehalobacter]AFV01846.1 hypothetical protein DHBDCA_p817 [Dehalobacter sp. DCA]AFV04883.1 hypothetical protein DCF50_p876 [Dehalobacter sp. CF]EQB20671.1 hypothetical protein UNSWDHB_2000 [Dehalobacter sp. UNSWDHB]
METTLEVWRKYLENGIKCLGDGNTEEAEKSLQISLIEAEALEIPVIIAFSQRLLAAVQMKNNKLNDAEAGFRRALACCKQLHNNKGIAEARAGLASVYFSQGKNAKAIYLYKQAIRDYPREASSLRLAALYSDLGQVYIKIKEWQAAEETFLHAENLCRKHGYLSGEAEISLCLGEIYYSQAQRIAAQKRFYHAAKIYARLGEQVSLANALQYIVFLYFEKDRLPEALLLQQRVVAMYLKNGRDPEVSESYFMLSNLLQCSKLLDEAISSLELSIQYHQGSEFGFAVRYYSLAILLIMKQDYSEAKKQYLEALKYFQFFGDSSKIGEISEELTYLIRYEDTLFQENLYKLLGKRFYDEPELPKGEAMLKLANLLMKKGKNMEALRCGWIALVYARSLQDETKEIELLIQDLSQTIRYQKKTSRLYR